MLRFSRGQKSLNISRSLSPIAARLGHGIEILEGAGCWLGTLLSKIAH